MADATPVGIDLGTTNSAVACVEQSGRTAMIANAEGDILTPSVVLFEDTQVVVGKEARSAATVHPDQVAEWVKRDMGSPVYSRPIRGEYLPPEVIQACILRKLKTDVAAAVKSDAKVVITVPAYFDEPRRKATADSGEMAGLTVLDIVNEPTAAALAFGEMEGFLDPAGKPLAEMNVLVYDLGGGTFDVTLLRLAPGDIRTLATDGDVQLGGHDWDGRLLDHVAESFKEAHGLDPRDDPAALKRLYNSIIEAKHTLSARSRANIELDHSGQYHEVQVTREEFEDLTADLLERTCYTTRQVLAAAGLDWSQVDRLLLVGGSTRMPMVAEKLIEMTGLEPDHTVNPDEAVARGAALYARFVMSQQDKSTGDPAFNVTNVNSHSLGIEGIDQETHRKINVVLIPRNTQLPARFTDKFITKTENQKSIVIQVLEGESSMPSDCNAIGRTVIRNLPPGLPKAWPIEVTFEYAANGRLTVLAVVPGTHHEVALEIDRESGLSSEGISGWKEVVTSASGFADFESLVDEALREAAPTETAGQRQPAAAESYPPPPEQPQAAPAQGYPNQPPPSYPDQPPPDQPKPLADYQQQPYASQYDQAAGEQTVAYQPAPEPTADYQQPDAYQQQPADPAAPQSGDFAQVDGGGERPARRIPKWLITVVGFILSGVIGITLGYMLISRFIPDHGLRFWE